MKRIGIMVIFVVMMFLIMGMTSQGTLSADNQAELLPLVVLSEIEEAVTLNDITESVSVTDQIESLNTANEIKVTIGAEERSELFNISELGIISRVSFRGTGKLVESNSKDLLYAEMTERINSDIPNDNIEFIYIGDIRGSITKDAVIRV